MFLKSLILRGFKTFADLTEIEFSAAARITAIVGPNGCGKSNIMDATRWALGEDNPRNLRVAQLANIIFAGTTARKPLSLAEVVLVFDNLAGQLPIPFSEVAIKRRTFREGESEFLINKNLCRLKDIKDLLLDTGLGEGTYAIITQGQVDAILSRKGEERRAVFEEAAGINKYKFRKVAAEKKLIAAEQNMLRLSDLKIEVAENVITLEAQAKKAREYLAVQSRVRELDLGLSKALLTQLTEKKTRLLAALVQVRATAALKKDGETQDRQTLRGLKEEHKKTEQAIDELVMQLDRAKDYLRDLELDRRFTQSELTRAEQLGAELAARATRLQEKIAPLEVALKQPNRAADLSDVPLAVFFNVLTKQTAQLVDLLNSIFISLGKAAAWNLSFGRSADTAAADQLRLEILLEEMAKINREQAQVAFSRHAQASQLAGLQQKIEAAHGPQLALSQLSQKKQGRDELAQQINSLEDKIRHEDETEKQSWNEAADLEVALAKLEGEFNSLQSGVMLEYNLNLAEVAAVVSEIDNLAKAKKDVAEGKSRLRSLEPVNLLAIEECARSQERLAFIEAQLVDLNAARDNLRGLIVELDRKAEQTFMDTMQQLSVVFSETFSKLFSGGEAKISLTSGAPPLEAEIEISVRPSGRKWLPLPLLSGGERSLSAIAILFSLLKIRPSPFCFLDEVDAALDDANIGRFTSLLQDFSRQSQIIVITHNKRTMNAADNIYGITMEEPGVSKVISMKLTEAVT